ncbi:MAG: MmgE/PrpD family protein [Thermoleophilaceae bacterium]
MGAEQHGRPRDAETHALAAFVSEIDAGTLSADVVARAKQIVADSIACAIGGLSLAPEISLPILRYAQAIGGKGDATVIGGGAAAAPVAALTNATLVHTIDFDDTHMASIGHFGGPVTATALAALESVGGSGGDLIAAVVGGFEAGGKVGRSVLPDHYQRWHSTASLGGIAAAAAAARARGLDARQTDMAIGFAADDAGGTRYCIKVGDFSKSLHAGTAAWKGSQGALLAALGAEGPTGLLEHPIGFYWAYSEERTAERLAPEIESLGSRWEVLEDDIKALPSIHASHTPVEATIEIVSDHDIAPGDIADIHVTHPFFSDGHALNYEPDSQMAARLSIPFCVAVAAMDRRLDLSSFEDSQYLRDDVRSLMRRVTTTSDESLNERYPDTTMSRVRLSTVRGGVHEVEIVYPRGSHRRPLSEEEHGHKVEDLLSRSLPDDAVRDLMASLHDLESLPSVRPIAASMARATRAHRQEARA